MTTLLSLPTPTNQSRLAILGATVRAELVAIGRPTSEMLTHAITIGGALHQARQLVGYGNWEKWLGTECGLSLRTAYTYLRLFAHRARIEEVLQRAAELQELSIRGALRLIKIGTTTRKRRAAASPLKSADWKAATLAQRTTFVAGIPLVEWLAAIPATMRAEIVDRIDGLRASQAKPVTVIMKRWHDATDGADGANAVGFPSHQDADPIGASVRRKVGTAIALMRGKTRLSSPRRGRSIKVLVGAPSKDLVRPAERGEHKLEEKSIDHA